MKLNWAERLIVNSPIRVLVQKCFLMPWMQKAMPLARDAAVLEIGCGRGVGAHLIWKEFRPRVLHALDLDHRMIRQARRYLDSTSRGKIGLCVGDAHHLPYKDGCLDAVFGFGVLHHLPDWRRGLAEVARVLKTGGFYFLEEFYPPFYLNFLSRRILLHPEEDRFFSHDLRLALDAARLAPIKIKEIKKIGVLAVCRKIS